MGTNNLFLREDGTVIEADHVNDYFTALVGPYVPRNASGIPTDGEASLGTPELRFSEVNLSNAGKIDFGGPVGSATGSIFRGGEEHVLFNPFDTRFLVGRVTLGSAEASIFGSSSSMQFTRPGDFGTNWLEYTDAGPFAGRIVDFDNIGQFNVSTSNIVDLESQIAIDLEAPSISLFSAPNGGAFLNLPGTGLASFGAAGGIALLRGNDLVLFVDVSGQWTGSETIRDDTIGSADSDVGINNSTGRLQRQTSSKRYKKHITEVTDSDADKLLELKPVKFRDKGAPDKSPKNFGFISEDVAEVVPELASYIEKDGKEIPESVKYSKITSLIVAYIKKQKDHIDSLEARIEALEAK